jgi:hypothetical protein
MARLSTFAIGFRGGSTYIRTDDAAGEKPGRAGT